MPRWYGGSVLNPDELVAPDEQWYAQWERIRRWHSKVLETQDKSEKQELDSFDMDTIITYFQDAYHLRDWFLASRSDLKFSLYNLFQTSFEMRACRDIANGFKHKFINRNVQDPDFNLYKEYDHFELEGMNPLKYRIAFADGPDIKKFDLFDLVEVVYLIWSAYIDKNVGGQLAKGRGRKI